MANANEDLNKHLKLAIRQLEELSTRSTYSIDDETFELIDKISGLLLEMTTPGSPAI